MKRGNKQIYKRAGYSDIDISSYEFIGCLQPNDYSMFPAVFTSIEEQKTLILPAGLIEVTLDDGTVTYPYR